MKKAGSWRQGPAFWRSTDRIDLVLNSQPPSGLSYRTITINRRAAFDKLAQMLLDHREGLMNYYEQPVRFGVVEAVNGDIRLLLRRGHD